MYVVGTSTTCQAIWMQRILNDLLHEQEDPTTISYDNKYTISVSKNHVFHKKTNHIDTIYHFIQELVNNRELIPQHCKSKEQLANIFTKALAQEKFEYLRKMLGIVNIDGVLELFSNFYYFLPLQPSELNSSTSLPSLINSPSINTIVNVHILLQHFALKVFI